MMIIIIIITILIMIIMIMFCHQLTEEATQMLL